MQTPGLSTGGRFVLQAAALLMLSGAASAYQDTRRIAGLIIPSPGESRLPPGMRVILQDIDSVYSRTAVISESMRFEFPDVPAAARCRIILEAEGRAVSTADVDPRGGQVVTLQMGARLPGEDRQRPGSVDIKTLRLDSPAGREIRRATEDIHKDNLDSALRHAQKALAIRPDLSEAHATKALALLRMGKHSSAEEALLEAVWLDRGNAAALRMLGWLYLATGRPLLAIDSLTSAAALDPTSGPGQIWLAEALYRTGRYADAAGLLEKVLVRDPQSYRASYQLGYAYLRLRRPEDALRAFRRFLETNRNMNTSDVLRHVQEIESRNGSPGSDAASGPSGGAANPQ